MDIRTRLRFEQALAEIADLRARVATLEARVTEPQGERVTHTESRRADVRQLRQTIAEVLAAHADSDHMTAKEIGRALEHSGFQRVPPERTLRRHLTAVRGHGHAQVAVGVA